MNKLLFPTLFISGGVLVGTVLTGFFIDIPPPPTLKDATFIILAIPAFFILGMIRLKKLVWPSWGGYAIGGFLLGFLIGTYL